MRYKRWLLVLAAGAAIVIPFGVLCDRLIPAREIRVMVEAAFAFPFSLVLFPQTRRWWSRWDR